jgi:hypothetical protein
MPAMLSFTDRLETMLQRWFGSKVDSSAHSTYDGKMQALKLAQSFSASQILVVKRFLNTIDLHQVGWAEEAVSIYLVGAVDFIGKHQKCGIETRKQLIRLVLKSHVGIAPERAIFYFNEALHRQAGSDTDMIVRAGAKAARQWLECGKVETGLSLREQLDNCGVMA